MSIRAILVITELTLREVLRRRLLWVLLGLSAVSVLFVGWVVTQLVAQARDSGMDEARVMLGVSQVLVIIAFMFSFVLAMSGAFLAAPAVASDVESGVALAMLARPISRADLVLGRWLGLSLVTGGYAVVSAALAIGVVALVSGYVPPDPVTAIACLVGQSIATLTLALALGTRLPSMSAGAIAVVAFGGAWLGGFLGSVAGLLRAQAIVPTLDIVRFLFPTDLLWRGVIHGLEPPIIQLLARGVDRGSYAYDPFVALTPVPTEAVLWSIAWIVLVLAGGVLAFRRREL
ncbi:MAG: ABC transporter permease [Chloroflexi bacterium]|nr:ABC transporter permease [Chloroflexota bacterium]